MTQRNFTVAAVGLLANVRAESLTEAQAERLFSDIVQTCEQDSASGPLKLLYVAIIEDGDNLVNSWHARGAI